MFGPVRPPAEAPVGRLGKMPCSTFALRRDRISHSHNARSAHRHLNGRPHPHRRSPSPRRTATASPSTSRASVQHHGALFAFDASTSPDAASAPMPVRCWATRHPPWANACRPATSWATRWCTGAPHEANGVAVDTGRGSPINFEVELGERRFDLILHRVGYELVAEFEARDATADAVSDFALKAHRAMDRLKRQGSIDGLLNLSVEAVRQLHGLRPRWPTASATTTGGEVVAERRHERSSPSWAAAIRPATSRPRARRLYVINTLRLIADVQSAPVGLDVADRAAAAAGHEPVTLRSVSPIHIEYLRNMGVGASISISIVINGQLWGMLACHHRSAHRVPYAIRMARGVLAQVLASNVQSLAGARAGGPSLERGAAARLADRGRAACRGHLQRADRRGARWPMPSTRRRRW